MIERATPWYLHHANLGNTAELVSKHSAAVRTVGQWMDKKHDEFLNRDQDNERLQEFIDAGVPEKLVRQVLCLPALAHVPDIVGLADATGQNLERVASLYFNIESRFHMLELRKAARNIQPANSWQREAYNHLIDDLYSAQSSMTLMMLTQNASSKKEKAAKLPNANTPIDHWLRDQGQAFEHYSNLVNEISKSKLVDFSMLHLAVRQLMQWINPNKNT